MRIPASQFWGKFCFVTAGMLTAWLIFFSITVVWNVSLPPAGDLIVAVLVLVSIAILYRTEILAAFKKRAREKKPLDMDIPPGAPQPRFKLYEAACLLHGLDPLWPLIDQKTKDEYASLIRAAKEYRLKIIPLRNGFTTTVGDDKAKQHMALLGEVMNKGVWKTLPNGERQVTKPAEALRDIEVDRKALRGYLESESRPVPEFLNERFDADASRNLDFFS